MTLDLFRQVSDEKAVAWRRRLARMGGLYVGMSAAANVAAATALLVGSELGPS